MGRLFVSPREVVTITSEPPQIGVEKTTRSRGSFVDPFQSWRTGSDIFHGRPTDERDLSRSRRVVTQIQTRRGILPRAEISIHRPLRPSGAKLGVKPCPGIDDFDPTIDVGNPVEHLVQHLLDHQNFGALHSCHSTVVSWKVFVRHNGTSLYQVEHRAVHCRARFDPVIFID